MTDLKYQIEVAMETDNHRRLVKLLDECKGSYAVKYVLEALLKRGNEHTLQSLLALVDPIPKSEPHIVSRPSTEEEIMASDNKVIRDTFIDRRSQEDIISDRAQTEWEKWRGI
jgi:hypothetical protein